MDVAVEDRKQCLDPRKLLVQKREAAYLPSHDTQYSCMLHTISIPHITSIIGLHAECFLEDAHGTAPIGVQTGFCDSFSLPTGLLLTNLGCRLGGLAVASPSSPATELVCFAASAAVVTTAAARDRSVAADTMPTAALHVHRKLCHTYVRTHVLVDILDEHAS
jgi:hypothetical protein